MSERDLKPGAWNGMMEEIGDWESQGVERYKAEYLYIISIRNIRYLP